MRVIAILICYGVGTLLSLRSVTYAACLFIWSEIFRPIDFAWRVFEFPAAHLVAATLLLSLFMAKWQRRWNPVATLVLAMIGWIYVCAFFAVHRVVAMDHALFATKYLIPLVIISISLTTRWSQKMFLYTLAASVGLWAAQAGLHLASKGPGDEVFIRGGQMSDRNDFMAGVLACLPMLVYIARSYDWRYKKLMRAAAWAMIAMSLVAMVRSNSRGAILGAGLLFAFFLLATGRIGKRLVLGGAVVVVALMFMPDSVVERMSTIEMSTDVQTESSASNRLALAKIGIEMTLDYPITGVGPKNFTYLVTSYGFDTRHDPHTIWLKASAEYGFPMLMLFLLTIWLILSRLARERKFAAERGDRDTERLAITLSCSIVGFLGAATFLSQFLSEYFWAICCLTGAFIGREEYRRRNPDAATREIEEVLDDQPAPGQTVGAQ